MKTIKKYFIFSVLLAITTVTFGQNALEKEGDKKYNHLAYIDAIKIYEDVAQRGYGNEDMYSKLGDAYYFNANYIAAAQWYAKLFKESPVQSPAYNFRYGQSLKSLGEYTLADAYLSKYYFSQGVTYLNAEQYLDFIEKRKNMFSLNAEPYNTSYSDYPAYFDGKELYIVSANNTGKTTAWNNEPTSDIFLRKNNLLVNVSGGLNSEYNEGSIVITKDGNTMYFTRNDYSKNKLGKDSNKTTRLKLYKAHRINEKWDNIEELPFNSSEYSTGHPALSPDDRTLYFVSDMIGNGNKGGTDIFKVAILEDGTFGSITNEASLNTIGNEMFPFVTQDGTIFFSSNGHPNLGGLDVFLSKSNTNEGGFGAIENVGNPINSGFDDFAFMVNSSTGSGYMASNRNSAQSDDVFSVAYNSLYKEPCTTNVSGIVSDSQSGELLGSTIVSLIDDNNNVVARVIANTNGEYQFTKVDCNLVKFVRSEKGGYQTSEILLPEGQKLREFIDLKLSKRTISIKEGVDIGLLLNPIYFDLDKFDIRPDAAIELEKIISVLKQHPQLQIDVRSHTDSRANDDYNLNLSNRRAKATIDYLVRQGNISKERLQGRGYGETQLKNNCSNGIECSETQHQQNRRSEFIIIKK